MARTVATDTYVRFQTNTDLDDDELATGGGGISTGKSSTSSTTTSTTSTSKSLDLDLDIDTSNINMDDIANGTANVVALNTYTKHTINGATLHWDVSKTLNAGSITITFDESSLPDEICYDAGVTFNFTKEYNQNSYIVLNKFNISDYNTDDTAYFSIKNTEQYNSKPGDITYDVKIPSTMFYKTSTTSVYSLLPTSNTYSESFGSTETIVKFDNNVVFNPKEVFTIVENSDTKGKFYEVDIDIYIKCDIIYYTLSTSYYSGDSDDSEVDEAEKLYYISGNFFWPGTSVYYVEGKNIKKFTVYSTEITHRYLTNDNGDLTSSISTTQTSLIDTHKREHIDTSPNLYISKEDAVDVVLRGSKRKSPESKNVEIKYDLGEYAYALLDGAVHYVEVVKIVYTYTKSMTNIERKDKESIVYTLQERNVKGDLTGEWNVEEITLYDSRDELVDALDEEDNMIYVGCDVCEV